MKFIIRNLSPKQEFRIVILLSLALPLVNSTWGLIISLFQKDFLIKVEPGSLYGLIHYEIVSLILVYFFLQARGWKLQDFNLKMSWGLTLWGIVLLGYNYMLDYSIYFILSLLISDSNLADIYPKFQVLSSLLEILLFSIVNPVFEEIIVVGYIIKSLERRHGMLFVISASTLIRCSYHTYQGYAVFFSILPLGLLYAYIYWHWRKLWVLILPHGLLDFIGLCSSLSS